MSSTPVLLHPLQVDMEEPPFRYKKLIVQARALPSEIQSFLHYE